MTNRLQIVSNLCTFSQSDGIVFVCSSSVNITHYTVHSQLMDKKQKAPKPFRITKEKKGREKLSNIFGTVKRKGKELPPNNLETIGPVLDKILDQLLRRGIIL